MQRVSAVMLLCLVASAVLVDAGSFKSSRIQPRLDPESSKKFNSDYPRDKRAEIGTFHFNHPYPVVQDSEDYDKDFVKDQNTDNGEWTAQMEYDKLRAKVEDLRKKAKRALAKKTLGKSELDEAWRKYQADMAKDRDGIAKKTKEEESLLDPLKVPEKPVKPVKPVAKEAVKEKKQEPKAPAKKEESWSWQWPWSWPKAEEPEKKEEAKAKQPEKPKAAPAPAPKAPAALKPKPTLAPIDTTAAEQAVARAVENLKGCEDQLAQAKAELKKLMDDLKEAKLKQVEAHEQLKQAANRYRDAQKNGEQLHGKYSEEAKARAAAEAAYLKQKDVVAKLRAQLKAAAAKVEAMRASEDKGGGVYPTPTKSSANSMALLVVASTVFARWQMV